MAEYNGCPAKFRNSENASWPVASISRDDLASHEVVSEGSKSMCRNWISVASALLVVVAAGFPSEATAGQAYCEECQSDCNDCRPSWRERCCGCLLGRCMWGQMVSDGMGGSIRVYGFPQQRVCGSMRCPAPPFMTRNLYPEKCPPCGEQVRAPRRVRNVSYTTEMPTTYTTIEVPARYSGSKYPTEAPRYQSESPRYPTEIPQYAPPSSPN